MAAKKENKEVEVKENKEVEVKDEKSLEKEINQNEKSLKAKLEKMKKVPLEIPEDPNNPNEVVPIGWNGIIYAVPRGKEFMVPVVIRDIWKESYQKTKAANKRIEQSINKELKVY
ncbi:hypothetical protein [Ornithinibacillus xuwenensis]|uniref:Uncharacterized protein n=1 Tax=Ornithinibacillus xuwenensis TaxID=3144668 RepID=A0ABU9XBZ1_9BACI